MIKRNFKGSSLLEMILFLPLAALIFFVGTDTALYATDKAAIADILRGRLAEAKSIIPTISTISDDENLISALTTSTAQLEEGLVKSISVHQSVMNGPSHTVSEVAVVAIKVDILPATGQQESANALTSCRGGTNVCALISNYVSQLNSAGSSDISPYAILQGYRDDQQAKPTYFSHAIVITAAIHTSARSLNPQLTRLALGDTPQISELQSAYIISY